MVTPSSINFIFWRQGETQQFSHFAKMSAPTFDMTKLAEVGELIQQFDVGSSSLVETEVRLDAIANQPPLYNRWLVAVGYALSGAGFAVLLTAAWNDVLFAAILSLVVYAVVLLAGHSKWVAHRLEMSSAFVVSVLANAIAIITPGSNPFVVTLCAVIVLIPGLALTLGLAEVLAKHIDSGISRLVDGVMVTFKLFLGAAIGTVLVNAIQAVPDAVVPPGIPAVWTWLFVALLVVGLAIVFQVRTKDFGWTVLGGLLAYAGIAIGNQIGFWQGSFIGALLLGVYSNLFAWRLGRPTSIVMLTAIMVLVPGAGAYRGLQMIKTSGLASGLSAEWHVLVNVAAIIAGLVVAYSVIPPKATL